MDIKLEITLRQKAELIKRRIDKTQNIVHCNWGWLGNSNGYFVSGIFKTNEGVSYDYSDTPQNEKYWYLFNTITYDKPVKT